MRGGLAGLLIMAALPALAQAPPAPRPEVDHAPSTRPEARPETHAEAKPPEARPAAPADPLTGASADKAAPQGEPTAPKAATTPAEPPGPPQFEALREDDFHYSACLLDLSLMGADYSELPAVTDPDQRDCGIARPIMLRAPLPGVEIPGGAVMRCETAWHLAHWLGDFVRPAADLLPGQPRLAAIEPGTTYQCRQTVGNAGEKLSEHAFGNAFDVAALRFQDGSRLEIAPREDSGDMAEAFQRAIRGAACLHFTTVLGPGANAAHDNHLHLDIKARRNGWRLCQ
ncbi:extensin [Paracoccus limosus]|uniref:Extensin n=1 Tax=Paracoccus limosus TaxID=913252 RepID=A0A844H3Y4_9RHOB|nr:extensin family protein [Paracoccus limosus]MTH34253.1 extensin [Paracoccus limosus]